MEKREINMKELEEKVLMDGKVLPGGVLKVDSFLNHQIDPQILMAMANELKRLYDGYGINKVMTVEASGIAIAVFAAYVFNCKAVFAKKSKTSNISDDVYSAEVRSFTHGNTNTVVCSKEYLCKGDKVLIVDDFLAHGEALRGLISICEQAGAEVVGCGIAIEKVFQGGGNELREKGIRVESLCKIASMSDTSLEIC